METEENIKNLLKEKNKKSIHLQACQKDAIDNEELCKAAGIEREMKTVQKAISILKLKLHKLWEEYVCMEGDKNK